MNRTIVSALVLSAAALAGNAFADDITIAPAFVPSGITRAQVQAELQQYKQAGVNPWSTSYNPLRGFNSAQTRSQVTADYLRSRNEVAALNGEDSGSFYLAHAHTGTRATKLAEAAK
jgi:hypothetical protein